MTVSYLIDTDLGSDIDDAWALIYMLLHQVDIKAICVSHGNTGEKALLVARLLQKAGRTDIPICVGPATSEEKTALHEWTRAFDLAAYKGRIIKEALLFLTQLVQSCPHLIILGLSPATTLAQIIEGDTELSHVTLVQMGGSVHRGYDGSAVPCAEWNVKKDVASFKTILDAAWQVVLAPLDATEDLVIGGEDYQKIKRSSHWAAKTLLSCYASWDSRWSHFSQNRSSHLFDLAAADIALHLHEVQTHSVTLSVTADGRTVLSGDGSRVSYVSNHPKQQIIDRFLAFL